MPSDNVGAIAPGDDVAFPQDGPTDGSVTRLSDSSFVLTEAGTYLVLFNTSVTETGQLVLTLGGAELDYTLVGRDGGTSHLIGMSIVTTPGDGLVLTVRNPAAAEPITLTAAAGGTSPNSAHLIIVRLA